MSDTRALRQSRGWGRLLAVMAVAGAVGALLAPTGPSAARAAEGKADSSITIEWGTGKVTVGPRATASAAEVAALQPNHAALTSDGAGGDAGSGHWSDFKNLKVRVSQTVGLKDQVVSLTATGMAPTTADANTGATNFLQVFQCYGNDPNAADFAKTCQWGGFSPDEVGGSGVKSLSGVLGTTANYAVSRGGVPFRAVQGVESAPEAGQSGGMNQGIARFFDSSSSSEQPFVPFDKTGTAQSNVVVQSAAAQPYLGCGDPAGAGERCWLVVVPRGTHSNAAKNGALCGFRISNNTYGGKTLFQTGAVFSPDCTLWADRIVVPLDFANPYSTCLAGSAERRIVGSELLNEAMSSWQSSLCQGGGATFALTTNSGNLSRGQLIGGQAALAVVSQPVTAGNIGLADLALLDGTDLRYAPLANTALTISFLIDEKDGTTHRRIRLTPRLIAKMLTQSYAWDIPAKNAGYFDAVSESRPSLKWASVFDDPEWAALGNPTDFAGNTAYSWEVTGPQGDDAIRLLWRYVLADGDAVAFLRGEADPWGATVNRYYLPPGAPNALGGGLDLLSAPLDTFPKADLSTNVSQDVATTKYQGKLVDSIGYMPYAGSFAANADRIARADSQRVNEADPNSVKIWVSLGPSMPANGQGRALLGPVTAASADAYGLATADLALPLSAATTKDTVASARNFVAYSDASVAAAIAAQPAPSVDTITEADPSALPAGAYPLASTVYAALDLNSSSLNDRGRADYAALLDYAAASTRTGERGGLPEGYVALTEQQSSVSTGLAAELRAWQPKTEAPPSPATSAATTGEGAAGGNSAAAGAPAVPAHSSGAAPATSMSSSANTAKATTEISASAGQTALGATLLAAVAGLVASPFLLRRRPGG